MIAIVEYHTSGEQMETSCSPCINKSSELAGKMSSPETKNRLSPRKRCTPPEAESETDSSSIKKQRDSQSESFLKEPPTSPQERRKSLRRSSAKHRRRSLPPLYYNTTELSDAISLGLPESDRLSELLQSCFQFSIKKLEESLKYTDGFDQDSFNEKGKSFINCNIKNLAARSVAPNLEMEALQAHMREHISKFSSECQSWDQLLEDYKTKAEVISRQLKENTFSEAPSANVSHVQTSQDKVIQSKPDYSRVLNQQGEVFDCMEVMLDELQESIHLLNSFLGDTTQHLQKMSTQLKTRSFKQLENSPVRKFLKIPQK
ncbi:LOW QUALITY PROTEIN: kinetochore-associated protein DSN1 homolog [Discoglossus pictus]